MGHGDGDSWCTPTLRSGAISEREVDLRNTFAGLEDGR